MGGGGVGSEMGGNNVSCFRFMMPMVPRDSHGCLTLGGQLWAQQVRGQPSRQPCPAARVGAELDPAPTTEAQASRSRRAEPQHPGSAPTAGRRTSSRPARAEDLVPGPTRPATAGGPLGTGAFVRSPC